MKRLLALIWTIQNNKKEEIIMKKRFFALLCGSILLLSTLAGCQNGDTPVNSNNRTHTTKTADIPEVGAPISALPVPMVGATSVPDWEPIPFEVKYNQRVDHSSELNSHIAVLQTYEELQTLYQIDDIYFKEQYNYTQGYDETFFQENALIMVFHEEGSSSNHVSVQSVLKNDKTIFVLLTTEMSTSAGLADMAYHRSMISVSKTDLQGVTQILARKQYSNIT